jgi:hypothetical protein
MHIQPFKILLYPSMNTAPILPKIPELEQPPTLANEQNFRNEIDSESEPSLTEEDT